MIGNVYFEDIRTHITGHLQSATTLIKLAVSWLTDKGIFDLLMDKLANGVAVSLVTRNDYLNNHPDALLWNDFIAAGGELRFSQNGEQLHYKFILVDDAAVLCTSYNLTCFANGNNRENVMLFTDAGFVTSFVNEFKHLENTLITQTHVERILFEDVPAELHGFYNSTIANDKAKQRI
jgi:phosphatidylserine/phosphatidylglycerophosphate/cardiolipin synthase-like enzyme